MTSQLLLLLRVSKPEYNNTLANDYKLYMNNQFSYNKTSNLTKGQYDDTEGLIANSTVRVRYSIDNKKTWTEMPGVQAIHKNNYAYIFCMYGVIYDPAHYNKETNTYHHYVPWEYIKDFWKEDSLELLVIKNTGSFMEAFENAAINNHKAWAHGKIYYDLEEKLTDVTYLDAAMREQFESVFHKRKEPYEIQNEIRLAIINPDQPPYFELQLNRNEPFICERISLQKGSGIHIELTDLIFNYENTVPIGFSSKIHYYFEK